MAVTKVSQREIIEVPFRLPDGQILPHPALVISHDKLQNIEDGMFYAVLISTKNHHPELTIPIKNEWLSKPMTKQSFFITHIINMLTVSDVIKKTNCYLRQPHFDEVVDKIISNVIDGEFND